MKSLGPATRIAMHSALEQWTVLDKLAEIAREAFTEDQTACLSENLRKSAHDGLCSLEDVDESDHSGSFNVVHLLREKLMKISEAQSG